MIPLLNGVDHIQMLRARYRNVVPGAIRVESERIAAGRIRQSSPFLRVELAGAGTAAAELSAAVPAVARAEGARIDETPLRELERAAPDEMRSSMQRDVAAGREPELDAIAGPILRGGRRHEIPVPATAELAELVAARAWPQV